MTQFSSMWQFLPMMTGPESALMTAPGQMLEPSPTSTSPMSRACWLTQADGAMRGSFP